VLLRTELFLWILPDSERTCRALSARAIHRIPTVRMAYNVLCGGAKRLCGGDAHPL
jgi:hypothetical protein